jgi:hypothetical protein
MKNQINNGKLSSSHHYKQIKSTPPVIRDVLKQIKYAAIKKFILLKDYLFLWGVHKGASLVR